LIAKHENVIEMNFYYPIRFKGTQFPKKLFILLIVSCLTANTFCQDQKIKIQYLGHSSFIIKLNNEYCLLTDYGKPNAYISWGWNSPISDIGLNEPTILTYSHLHDDHYDSSRIPKSAKIILRGYDSLELKNLKIYPFRTSEKDLAIPGNTSFLFTYQDIRILHLGDCQANIIYIDSIPNKKYIQEKIPARFDIVFIPIESTSKFIPQVERFIELIQPKVVIPMHFWSQEYKSEFLKYMEAKAISEQKKYRILKLDSAEYNYTKSENSDSILIVDIERTELISK
jgi:L-ascorbate metabolism protein UlaG (beta-lactamase superfamily)